MRYDDFGCRTCVILFGKMLTLSYHAVISVSIDWQDEGNGALWLSPWLTLSVLLLLLSSCHLLPRHIDVEGTIIQIPTYYYVGLLRVRNLRLNHSVLQIVDSAHNR